MCLPQLYAKLVSGNNPYSDLIGIYSSCSSMELFFFQWLCVRFLSAAERLTTLDKKSDALLGHTITVSFHVFIYLIFVVGLGNEFCGL